MYYLSLITLCLSVPSSKIMLADKRRAMNPWQESTDRKAATKIQTIFRGYRQAGFICDSAPRRLNLSFRSMPMLRCSYLAAHRRI